MEDKFIFVIIKDSLGETPSLIFDCKNEDEAIKKFAEYIQCPIFYKCQYAHIENRFSLDSKPYFIRKYRVRDVVKL